MPSIPSHCGCGAGKAPRPISVQVTGKRSAVASSVSSAPASALIDAAAGVDHRPARVGERLGGEADLLRVALGGRLVAGQADVADRLVVDLRAREVDRHVDQHRARAAGARDVERLVHDPRDLRRVLDHERVLDDRHGDAERVRLLEAVRAQQVGAHLAGEDHERDRVHHRVGQRRDDVGRARARRWRRRRRPCPRPWRSPRRRGRRRPRGGRGRAGCRRRRTRRRSGGWRRRGSRIRRRRPRP